MRFVTAREVHAALDFETLVERIRESFRQGCSVPDRHHYKLTAHSTLLVMPVWQREHIGVKIVTAIPSNKDRNLPTVSGVFLLLDGVTGEPLATMDGAALTVLRTAAASALAASFLARPDSHTLLMVGAGALAPHLIRAHATVRPISVVRIWNRQREKAERLAGELEGGSFQVEVVDELADCAGDADIICCATSSVEPLLQGQWLSAGCHLDLVGSYTPQMREVDDQTVQQSRIFVDTLSGALREAGDLLGPLSRGIIREQDIVGDLAQLTRGEITGRREDREITLFKSVGTALEDLAAAQLVWQRLEARQN